MLGKLLKRFFRRTQSSRPVSPPPPPLPARPVAAPVAAPPPPPPGPTVAVEAEAQAVSAPVQDALAARIVETPTPSETDPAEPGSVRFVLADGTIASPDLDPELEERLKYIVDNIVQPTEPPPT